MTEIRTRGVLKFFSLNHLFKNSPLNRLGEKRKELSKNNGNTKTKRKVKKTNSQTNKSQ